MVNAEIGVEKTGASKPGTEATVLVPYQVLRAPPGEPHLISFYKYLGELFWRPQLTTGWRLTSWALWVSIQMIYCINCFPGLGTASRNQSHLEVPFHANVNPWGSISHATSRPISATRRVASPPRISSAKGVLREFGHKGLCVQVTG